MLAGKAVLLMTIPLLVIVSVLVPKLLILALAAWTVAPGGAWVGHRHVPSRAGRQSDGAVAGSVWLYRRSGW